MTLSCYHWESKSTDFLGTEAKGSARHPTMSKGSTAGLEAQIPGGLKQSAREQYSYPKQLVPWEALLQFLTKT